MAVGAFLGYYLSQYHESDKLYSDISVLAASEDRHILIEDGKKTIEFNSIPIDFEKLQTMNSDCIGWIDACDKIISYPVVMGEDNEFYLTHSFDKKTMRSGTVFAEAGTVQPFKQYVTNIYGHNMKDGSMFSELLKYKDEQYLKNHPEFMIYIPGEELNCVIFSVFYTDNDEIPYWDVTAEESDSDAEAKAEYVAALKKMSRFDTGVEADANDVIVNLITCEYTADNNRMVVCARCR